MFEMQHYETHYFEGADGAENWEDFVGESRAEHDANISDRLRSEKFGAEQTESTETFTFSEIGAEEADRAEAAYRAEETAEFSYKDLLDEEDLAALEESYEDDEAETAAPAPVPQAASAVQPVIDISTLLETIREEVRREMTLQQQLQRAAVQQPVPEPVPESTTPSAAYVPDEPEEPVLPKQNNLPDVFASGTESLDDENDSTRNDLDSGEKFADSFIPSFDINAILDEQLDNYNEMTLGERMDEINVNTMEVSLDELADYVKENRKRRGA
jgi:hypothetical protein